MNAIALSVTDGKITTTSTQIAEVFGKRHTHVLRAIDNLDCSPEFTATNFGLSEVIDATGKANCAFTLTRDGFVFLCMGFTGKEAAAWKEKYIAAFNAMEDQLANPSKVGAGKTALVVKKRPIKSRDDLSFTKRDDEYGRLINWVVPHKRDEDWGEGWKNGHAFFAEVVELAQHSEEDAPWAVKGALYGEDFRRGPGTEFTNQGWGAECGFVDAIASAVIDGLRVRRVALSLPKQRELT